MMRNALNIAELIREAISQTHSHSVTVARPVRRSISREIRMENGKAVIDAAVELIGARSAPRWFVYELIHHHAGAMSELNVRNLERIGSDLDGWGITDPFACYLSGPSWRTRQIRDSTVHKWARSRDRWWRRVAVVSTVPLNNSARGGTGDADKTLAVCDLVVNDNDDMIIKAVSWALRELSQKCPNDVAAYIELNHKTLSYRIVREVSNKLTTGLKSRNSKR